LGLGLLTTLGAAQQEGAAEGDKVVKVLRTSNKAQTNRYVCGVYDFNQVNPYAVINYFASGLIREEGGIYSFVAPNNTSGKVLVICPEYQLDSYADMARQLDVKDLTSAPGSAYEYIPLEHRSALDNGFLDIVRNYSSFNSVVLGDVETNSVFIWDSHSGADYAKEALKAGLDVPTQQVVVEVKIYEINSTNDGRLGLDYEAWKNGPGRELFGIGASGTYYRHYNPDFRNTRTGYQSSFLLDYPSEFFDFLVEKGRAKLMTRTELAAMNNTQASVFAGDAILYFKETNPTSERERTVEVDIESVETGVGLVILPTVGKEMLNLEVSVSVTNHLGYAENGEPRIGERNITQDIRVPDNQEVMLGGISRTRTISETAKVPILGSIPVLGYLFGGETESTENSTVVIALRPKIADAQKNMTADHKATMDLVDGTTAVKIPETPIGFDQWLFDKNNTLP